MPVAKRRRGKQATGKQSRISSTATTTTTGASASEYSEECTTAAVGPSTLAKPSKSKSDIDDLILTSERRRGVYECDYCRADISQLPRIRCAVCVDFDLCIDCFVNVSQEPSSSSHRRDTHGYRVCDSTRYPLFPTAKVVVSTTTSTPSVAGSTSRPGSTIPDDDDDDDDANINANKITENTNDINKEDGDKNDNSAEVKDLEGGRDASASTSRPVDPNPSHHSTIRGNAPPSHDHPGDDSIISTTTNTPQMPASTEQGEGSRETPAMVVDMETNSVDDATNTNVSSNNNNISSTAVSTNGNNIVVVQTDDRKLIWTVEEDLRLLEGIQMHGLANWGEISEVVSGYGSTGKTAKRCMERYWDDFLGRYGHILPPYTLVSEDATIDPVSDVVSAAPVAESTTELTDNDETPRQSKRRAVMMRTPLASPVLVQRKKSKVIPTESLVESDDFWPSPFVPEGCVMGQEVGRDQAYKAEQAFIRASASCETAEKAQALRREWEETRLLKPGGPTVLPIRPDDIATLPGAELVGFMPRRGDFDIEWENEAEQMIADMEFTPGESASDRKLKLAVLQIYNDKLDEREQRKQFLLSRKLYDYRARQKADQELPRDERDLVMRMRLFERFHTPSEHEIFLADILKAKRLRKEIAKLQTYRRIGIRTMAEAEKYELDKARYPFHKTLYQQKEANKTEENRQPQDTPSTLLWKQYRSSDRSIRRSVTRGGDNTESSGVSADNPAAMETASNKGSLEAQADTSTNTMQSSLLEYRDLSSSEEALCVKLSLTAKQYLEIKKVLVRESVGLLKEKELSRRILIKIDSERRGDVIDFLVRAGWVTKTVADGAKAAEAPFPELPS